MNKLILLFFIISFEFIFSQVGINTVTPDASSALEIVSNNKGILIPRVPLTSTTDIVTITAPAKSLIVFNSNTNANITEGFYYWDSTKWVRLNDAPSRLFNGSNNPNATTPAYSIAGDVFVNNTTGDLFTYNGSNWVSQSTAVSILTSTILANEGQTEFTTPWDISTTNTKVYRNGVNISFTILSSNLLKIENEAICYPNDEIKIYKYL